MKHSSVFFTCISAFFAAFLAVCAVLAIPVPFTGVPVSLLNLGLFLVGGILPPKLAFRSAGIHLLLGLMGLPVFSGLRGGPGMLLGPTGGYLWMELPVVCLIGVLLTRFSRSGTGFWGRFGILALGGLVHTTGGTLWFCTVTQVPWTDGLLLCVIPFLLPDLCKLVLAAGLLPPLHRILMHISSDCRITPP